MSRLARHAGLATISPRVIVFAILRQAEQDLFDKDLATKREAYRWMYLDATCDSMSFLWCCDVLGLDPIRVREQTYLKRPGAIQRLHMAAVGACATAPSHASGILSASPPTASASIASSLSASSPRAAGSSRGETAAAWFAKPQGVA